MPSLPFYIEHSAALSTVNDLRERFTSFTGGDTRTGVYLRGQADTRWGLVPTVARTAAHGGKVLCSFTLDQERQLLHRFRRGAYSHLHRVPDPWEALFLARHHGLPVRLLDWTANPLVALYWACDSQPKDDGAVFFCVRNTKDNDYLDILDGHTPDFTTIPGVRFIHPFCPTHRMTTQAAVFTIHCHPWSDATTALGQPDCEVARIEKWRVSKDAKPSLIQELRRLGIDTGTLLPELDGLAKSIWQTEVLRSGT